MWHFKSLTMGRGVCCAVHLPVNPLLRCLSSTELRVVYTVLPSWACNLCHVLSCRWKCLGESLLAMYQHMTTCEPPQPSLGKRIDLLEYQDLEQHLAVPTTLTPVSVIQPSPVSTNPVMSVTEPLLTYTPVTPTFPSPNLLESVNSAGEKIVIFIICLSPAQCWRVLSVVVSPLTFFAPKYVRVALCCIALADEQKVQLWAGFQLLSC